MSRPSDARAHPRGAAPRGRKGLPALSDADSTTRAYTFIRNKILEGAYPPGTSLSANALSAQVGVSRTPVLDALRRLQLDGLVVIRPKLGAMVKFMELKDFQELCWMRKVLESNAAGLAALNHKADDLVELEQAHHEMESLAQTASTLNLNHAGTTIASELARADVRFHVAVMNAAHNGLLRTEIVRLRLINRVVGGITPAYIQDAPLYAEETRKTLREHQRIRDAIVSRDAAEATAAMAEHIQDILDHSIQRMRENRDPRGSAVSVA